MTQTSKTIKQLADEKYSSFNNQGKERQLTDWLLEQGFEPKYKYNRSYSLDTRLSAYIQIILEDGGFTIETLYGYSNETWSRPSRMKFFYADYTDMKKLFKQIKKACKKVIKKAQI